MTESMAAETEYAWHFKDPYYYILVGFTWIGAIVWVAVGLALLMGWLPGWR